LKLMIAWRIRMMNLLKFLQKGKGIDYSELPPVETLK
jgi:hypothetical protein